MMTIVCESVALRKKI